MRPRLQGKALKALLWPLDIPELAGSQICPYTEPHPGKKTLWDWLRSTFDPSTATGAELHDQFLYLLMDVARENVVREDRAMLVPSDIPTPVQMKRRNHYSPDEVAAWWNETRKKVLGMLSSTGRTMQRLQSIWKQPD